MATVLYQSEMENEAEIEAACAKASARAIQIIPDASERACPHFSNLCVILAHTQCFIYHLALTVPTVLRRISPEAWYQSAELSESEMTV